MEIHQQQPINSAHLLHTTVMGVGEWDGEGVAISVRSEQSQVVAFWDEKATVNAFCTGWF